APLRMGLRGLVSVERPGARLGHDRGEGLAGERGGAHDRRGEVVTTRARQGAARDKIDAAIKELEEASYACGEWHCAYESGAGPLDDQPYRSAVDRCDRARERLRRLVLDGSPQ